LHVELWAPVCWAVSTLCAVVPPPGLYGVVGTGLLCDVSTLCAVVPPPGLYGVVGTGLLCDVSTDVGLQLGALVAAHHELLEQRVHLACVTPYSTSEMAT
jgi:hypothetical protein